MWWAVSLILVIGLVGLWWWLAQLKIKVTWYATLLSLLGLLLLVYAAHNFADFRAEHEMVAAWNALLIFGLPALVLLAAASGLTWLKQLHRKKASS